MAIAQGSQNSAWYVEQVAADAIPATPAWKPLLRKPGNGMTKTRDNIESETIDGSGFARCSSKGNLQVTGAYECEDFFLAHDDLLRFGFGGAWETDQPSAGKNRLKAGMLRPFFAIEEQFEDIGLYQRFLACEVGSIEFTVAPNAAPQVNFNIIGRDATGLVDTEIAGATYGTPTTNCPFSSFAGYLKEAGVSLGVVTQMQATLDRGLEANYAVFSDKSQQPSASLLKFTGTLSIYFEDETIYNKWENSTESTLEMQLIDPAGNARTLHVPRAKYTGMTINRSGLGSITMDAAFEAQLDAVSGTNVYIVTDAS